MADVELRHLMLALLDGKPDMWVLTDAASDAALATYRRAGATSESPHVMLEWPFED